MPQGLLTPCIALALALALAGCGNKDSAATQVAAQVNKEEVTVHQVNEVLTRQPNLRAEDRDAVARKVLEALIDQELAVQQAERLKLDRKPQVMQQLAAARREILARALAVEASEAAAKPTAEDVAAYYKANPALFAERRVYSLQELGLDANADEAQALQAHLAANKGFDAFVQHLRANNTRFNVTAAVRAAEQLPLEHVAAVAKLKDGEVLSLRTATGLQLLHVQASRAAPLSLDEAKANIELYLGNRRKAELATRAMQELRANAKISYRGMFAQPPATAAPSVAPSPPPPASAASAASQP